MANRIRVNARLVVRYCFHVKAKERVLILADRAHREAAEAIREEVRLAKAEPAIADIDGIVARAMDKPNRPMEPPKSIGRKMVDADVVIACAELDYAKRLAHTRIVREARNNGVRIASVEDERPSMRDWNISRRDLQNTTSTTYRLRDALDGTETVRVTSKAGTDVSLSLRGRTAATLCPVKNDGDIMGPVPFWAEVAYAPVEERTEGVIVIDGIIEGGNRVKGRVKSPVRMLVKHGRVTEFGGGVEATAFEEVIRGSDSNANVIAELGIGTSKSVFVGSPSEKGLIGTAHFNLGENAYALPGGKNISAVHLGGTLRDVIISADGRTLVSDGKITV